MVEEDHLNELALFAGAGGGILGGHLLGRRTVCAVEWERLTAAMVESAGLNLIGWKNGRARIARLNYTPTMTDF